MKKFFFQKEHYVNNEFQILSAMLKTFPWKKCSTEYMAPEYHGPIHTGSIN